MADNPEVGQGAPLIDNKNEVEASLNNGVEDKEQASEGGKDKNLFTKESTASFQLPTAVEDGDDDANNEQLEIYDKVLEEVGETDVDTMFSQTSEDHDPVIPHENGTNGVSGNQSNAAVVAEKSDDAEVMEDSSESEIRGHELLIHNLKKRMASNEELTADDLYVFLDPKQPQLLSEVGGVKAVANRLGSDVELGLQEDSVLKYRELHGENRLPPPKFKSFLSLVWDAMTDRTLIMLSVAALISFIIGIVTELDEHGYKDGVAVFVAVIIVVAITSLNDYQKERQFRRLNDVKNDHDVTVIRDGERIRISIFELVVGDIVCIEAGDVVPADGIFISGESVQTDESSATGESDTIKKGHPPKHDPFFLSGTQVVNSSGTMLVICVGENSFHGRIMLKLRTEDQETPLQEKLSKLANLVGNFGIVTALIIFAAQLIKYFAVAGSNVDGQDALNNAVDCLIIAISIVVVAVPEGLPLAVTIALAYSMKYMMKDNNLVRRLEACETMGGATTVCSDKTGTLTQNKMTVVQGNLFQYEFDTDNGVHIDIDETGSSQTISAEFLRLLFGGLSINTSAYESLDEKTSTRSFIGSKTESALLNFVKNFGQDYVQYRDSCEYVQVYTFSSEKKRMTTIAKAPEEYARINQDNKPYVMYTKGAAEIILKLSSKIVNKDGSVVALSDEVRDKLTQQLAEYGNQSLRAIGLAYKFTESDVDINADSRDDNLVFLGLLGLQDPLRPEIKDAVASCVNAGVVVRMVTGDASGIAKNIGKNCGIYNESLGHECIEGPDFRHLSKEELVERLPNLRILARSSPEDKFRLVSVLQEMNEVVAVTGDGVNDGPALKQANVGFSMGLSGTEVAKEASTIVLLDDNFASIVNAIKWGRSVFDNIRKFLQFQLTVNFTAIIVILVAVLADPDGNAKNSPLKPVQLLWINLIMDSFAALSLATEKAHEGLLKFKPYGREEPLITSYMSWRISFQVVLQSITFLMILYFGESWFGTELPPMPTMPPTTTTAASSTTPPPNTFQPQFSTAHYTVLFNVFVLSQLTNQFCCRKLRGELNPFTGLGDHFIFLGVFLFSLIVQVLIVEFGGSAIESTSLSATQWGWCVLVGLFPLAWSTIFNIIWMILNKRPSQIAPMEENQAIIEENGVATPDKLHHHILPARELDDDNDGRPRSVPSLSTSRNSTDHHARLRSLSLWDTARDILTEVQVVNAFRGNWHHREHTLE